MKTYYYRSKKYFVVLVGSCLLIWAVSHFFVNRNRTPAAIEEQNLFNMFDKGDALHTALRKDIVTSIQIAKAEKNFQINVRNFLVKTPENQHLCEYFNSYTLTFEAEGMATSGERPTMVIHTPCELSAKTNIPVPVVVPVEDIFKLKPDDTDVSFEASPKASFSFRNVDDMWPEHWVLSKVQFSHSDFSSREVIIERREIYGVSKIPPTMEWGN
jgi:hypothetical protein